MGAPVATVEACGCLGGAPGGGAPPGSPRMAGCLANQGEFLKMLREKRDDVVGLVRSKLAPRDAPAGFVGDPHRTQLPQAGAPKQRTSAFASEAERRPPHTKHLLSSGGGGGGGPGRAAARKPRRIVRTVRERNGGSQC